MYLLQSSPWTRAADRMADLIKDAMLDGLDLDDDGDPLPVLPPLSPDEFAARMGDAVGRALRRMAEVISAAPSHAVLSASEEETCDLFTALWWEALQTGVRMRLEAAEAADGFERPRPEGEWARRYRRMCAADAFTAEPPRSP